MSQEKFLSFAEAIDFGKYEPDFLKQFAEWQTFDRYTQFQFIAKALKNRRRRLRLHWAELNNQLDYGKKPYLKEAQKKIEQAISDLNEEEERLLVEYAGA